MITLDEAASVAEDGEDLEVGEVVLEEVDHKVGKDKVEREEVEVRAVEVTRISQVRELEPGRNRIRELCRDGGGQTRWRGWEVVRLLSVMLEAGVYKKMLLLFIPTQLSS